MKDPRITQGPSSTDNNSIIAIPMQALGPAKPPECPSPETPPLPPCPPSPRPDLHEDRVRLPTAYSDSNHKNAEYYPRRARSASSCRQIYVVHQSRKLRKVFRPGCRRPRFCNCRAGSLACVCFDAGWADGPRDSKMGSEEGLHRVLPKCKSLTHSTVTGT